MRFFSVGLEKVISGGQTGADRAALDVAIRHEFPHGGWCPNGRMAEDGPIDPRYELIETPKQDSAQRTQWNVRDSDGTVLFTFSEELKGGSLLTRQFAEALGKPCLHIARMRNAEPERELLEYVAIHDIHRLNVAGSRESEEPGIYSWTAAVLESALLRALGGP